MNNDFNLARLQELNINQSKEYIKEYFIPLIDGNHAFKLKGKWIIYNKETLKDVFFNRMNDEINRFYFREYNRILIPVKDKSKPLFYDDYINFDYHQEELILKPYNFILNEFILKQQGLLSVKPSDLFKQYQDYSNDTLMKKDQFVKLLNEVKIKTVKSGTNVYKYSYEELLDIGITNEWLFKDKKDIENELLRDEITNLKSRINELEKLSEERAKSLAFSSLCESDKPPGGLSSLENVETIEVKEVCVGTEDYEDNEDDETEVEVEIKDIAVENENKNESVADDDDDEIILEGEDLL